MDSSQVYSWIDQIGIVEMDINFVLEAIGHFGAFVFLVAIVALMIRSARWDLSNAMMGLVFGAWIGSIFYAFIRFLLGIPPSRLHGSFYVIITVLEAICIYVMIREQNEVIQARREYNRCLKERSITGMTEEDCRNGQLA